MNPSKKIKVKRAPQRGFYDKETIYSILDSDFVCQVAFLHEDYPVIIPTIYGRKENVLYIHGATVSRMLVDLEKGIPISINVTHTKGIVLARSAFNHSLNYESVTIFGSAVLVESEEERMKALKIVSDQVLQDRWEEIRLPNEKEMKATKVLKIEISEASAKIRTGPPKDDKPDYDLPIWAGVIPINKTLGIPEPDPELKEGIELPNSVKKLFEND